MTACNTEFPFPLTHMSGDRYLLMLPPGSERHIFIRAHTQQLQNLGYIIYPWSSAINAYPLRLKYKVWIELRRVALQAWNLDNLISAVSSFGVVLDHTPMRNLRSLEKLMVAVAVTDLGKIPHNILLWVKGMARDIQVLVHGWIEEPLPFLRPLDTTPNNEFYEEVRKENIRAMSNSVVQTGEKELIAVDFDMLFSIWEKMEEGEKKNHLGETLWASSYYQNRDGDPGGRQSVQGPVMDCQIQVMGERELQGDGSVQTRDKPMLGLEGGPDPIIDDKGFEFSDFQAQGHHAYLL